MLGSSVFEQTTLLQLLTASPASLTKKSTCTRAPVLLLFIKGMLVKKKYHGAVSMGGLPLGTNQADFSAYLDSLLENQPSAYKEGVKVESMRARRKSCSAFIIIPRGKNKYQRLRALLKGTPFQGKVVNLQLRRGGLPKPALDHPAEEGETPALTGITIPQLKERAVLARGFHGHLMDLEKSTSVAMDRERGSESFQTWYQSFRGTR